MMIASLHDAAAMEAFFRERRLDPYLLKRWRYLLYNEGRSIEQLVDELPVRDRGVFGERFHFVTNQVVERVDSQLDQSSKLVYRTQAGQCFESVILRATSQRTSVCVSSQIGCAARCVFCATGHMPRVQNLTEAEILDQVVQGAALVRSEGRRLRNVVFMGMGEPLHNEAAVVGAVEKLQSPAYFGLSPRRVLVSTVGVPEPLLRFAKQFPLTNVAVSLHSARQEFREQLIPLARRISLQELREVLVEVNRLQRRPLMIEHLMLAGANDSSEDAHLLADYLAGLWVHVNLIPFNPIAQSDYRPTARPARDAFANVLRRRGYLVTVRYSQGADIGAACGQLIQSGPTARPALRTGTLPAPLGPTVR